MTERVTTSTRLWSQEVAAADALDVLDSAKPGAEGVQELLRRKTIGYEFSNGRTFEDAKGAYE